MTRWWLVVAVLIAPAVTAPGLAPTAATTALLLFLLLLVAARCASPWLQAFGALAALAAFVQGLPDWAGRGVLGIAAFLLVHQEVARHSARSWVTIRRAIALAAGLQIAWMGVQALGLDPVFVPVSYQGERAPGTAPAIGWFGNPSDTALFLALSLPALVAVSPWLFLPAAAALVALHSTTGLIGAALVAGWLAGRVWVLALALLVVVGLATLARVDPQGLGPRPTGWGIAARLAWVRPVLGWGPNAVDSTHLRVVDQTTRERWNFFFNEWLQGALELGLGGPLLAAGYLATLARRLRGRWAACGEALPAVLFLLAASLVSIPLRLGPTALLSALWLGRLESIAQEAA